MTRGLSVPEHSLLISMDGGSVVRKRELFANLDQAPTRARRGKVRSIILDLCAEICALAGLTFSPRFSYFFLSRRRGACFARELLNRSQPFLLPRLRASQ